MKFNSALMAGASGSVGGLVASHNRGGQYFRKRTVPVNPNTVQQQAVRSYLAALSARWVTTLTAAQRDAWANYGAQVTVTNSLGNQVHLTGLQWYVACNSLRLQASLTVVDAGPTVYSLATLTGPVATITAPSTCSLAFTNTDAWANEVGGALLSFASRPTGASINFFNGPYRYMAKVAGAGTPPTSPASQTLPFVCAAGQRVHLVYRAVLADGRISSPFRGFDDAA